MHMKMIGRFNYRRGMHQMLSLSTSLIRYGLLGTTVLIILLGYTTARECITCKHVLCGSVEMCSDIFPLPNGEDFCTNVTCRPREQGFFLNPNLEDVASVEITDVSLLPNNDVITINGNNCNWIYSASHNAFNVSDLQSVYIYNITGFEKYDNIPSPDSLVNFAIRSNLTKFPFTSHSGRLSTIYAYNTKFDTLPLNLIKLVDPDHTTVWIVNIEVPIRHVMPRVFFTQFKKLMQNRLYKFYNTTHEEPTCHSGELERVKTRENTTIPVCVLPDLGKESDSETNTGQEIIFPIVLSAIIVCILVGMMLSRRFCSTRNRTVFQGELNARLQSDEGKVQRDIIPFKRLKVMRKIAKGSSGEVYLARFSGALVVLKKQSVIWATEYEFDSFQKEIELFKSLKHPNVLQYIGITEFATVLSLDTCIVCEYMPQGDLHRVLVHYENLMVGRDSIDQCDTRSTEPCDFSEDVESRLMHSFHWAELKLSISVDIMSALAYLHDLRPCIVHRDLKSLNVLLNSNFQAKLCDFGASREVTTTSTMTALGSNLWMAPEVILGERFDEKADIFSFGVVISELITHKLPYSEMRNRAGAPMSSMAVSIQVANCGLRPSLNGTPPAPDFITELCVACFSERPEDRPTAKEALSFLLKNANGDL